MNNLQFNLSSVTSAEFGLTIALIVFVILFAVTLTFLILLFANKPFRALFFGSDDTHKKPEVRREYSARVSDAVRHNADNAVRKEAAAATLKPNTPPPTAARRNPAEPAIYKNIPTVVIPPTEAEKHANDGKKH